MTMKCQGCGGSKLEQVLDLGYQPLCNDFLPVEDVRRPRTFYPLCLCICHECSLAQLDYVIPTETAFGDQYTYLTGSSESLVRYYSELAERLVQQFDLNPGDTVVEIGCNDGTFLKAFRSHGMDVIGIDGAVQSTATAKADGLPIIQRFFESGSAAEIQGRVRSGSRIALVIGMNVLAHTGDINEFLEETVKLMDSNTVFISQSHWLAALVRKFEFDTIYHEHLRYYTLKSLSFLFKTHGLNINHAEITDFYGGSILAFAQTSTEEMSASAKAILCDESELEVAQSLRDMRQVLLENKAKLLNLLVEIRNNGKRVVGIGAPMKASTLLNFYGVTSDLVEYLGEVNQFKIGTVVPGVCIPVVDENVIFEENPDYALLLSWNMAEFLIPKFRSRGFRGKFILPVPNVEVID